MRDLSSRLSSLFGPAIYTHEARLKKPKAPPTGAFSKDDCGRFAWEKNDCSVRAMTIATGRPYAECHELLAKAGRKEGRGCTYDVLSRALGKSFTWTRVSAVQGRRVRPTAAAFVREHREGVYIVFVTGHFFALVNGQQIDMAESLYKPRARVYGFWRIA